MKHQPEENLTLTLQSTDAFSGLETVEALNSAQNDQRASDMDSHIHPSPSGSNRPPCSGSAQSRTFLELARLKAQSELK
jgi:hypothetical protein